MNRSKRQEVRRKPMRIVVFVFICTLCSCISVSLALEKPVDFRHGPLKVSENKRYLVHEDGTPFFYLGDTAWELFHRLNREEADQYLENRAAKGFSVIQAVALAELDGLNTPNTYGHKPLINNDPTKPKVKAGPNNDYWDHVDYIVNKAKSLGMYIGMLPTWGDKWNKKWGKGPVVFHFKNAEVYGKWLGNRYKDKPIIWILGGDRPVESDEQGKIVRAMALGLKKGDGGRHLMTFHPTGGQMSSKWFHNDDWLDFNMHQTGHKDRGSWNSITEDYQRTPTKPVIDGEPLYEDHPINFDPMKFGFSSDWHIRRLAYQHLFAGACGHTYGCHNIWQMYAPGRHPISWAHRYWYESLDMWGASAGGSVQINMTIEEFDWNANLQASDFEPNIPPDYTVMAQVDLSGSVEAVTKGLRGFANITEGQYPTNLDLMTTSQEIREAFIALRKKQGKSLDEQPTKEEMENILSIQGACMFYGKLVKESKDVAYYGDKVTAQDVDKVLMRWKISDNEYRVIFGDLSTLDVSAEKLAELEKLPPQ